MTRPIITEPLGTEHRRDEFFCGEPTLDVYLKQYATQDQKRRAAAIFVLSDDNHRIKGHYSLSSTNIPSAVLPKNLLKKLPKHACQPATLLGRLAVDQHDQKQGIGETLRLDALYRIHELSKQIETIAVVVETLNEQASAFYGQYGFIPFPDQKKLFLPIKTIARLFK